MRLYRLKNKDRLKKLQAAYYLENKDELDKKAAEYYKQNREKRRKAGRVHYEDNKALYLAYSRTRKALLKNRMPCWLSRSEIKAISDIYVKCKNVSERTGILHHVDHIVPLNGETVCGLHVPWNLQLLPALDNLRKSNKHE